jgi:hypothetical protein
LWASFFEQKEVRLLTPYLFLFILTPTFHEIFTLPVFCVPRLAAGAFPDEAGA